MPPGIFCMTDHNVLVMLRYQRQRGKEYSHAIWYLYQRERHVHVHTIFFS